MPSYEAPQTLQTRLAERLQSSTEDKSAPSWLAIKVSGQGFLLPLSQSGEIYPWVDPHRVPYTKDWFLGVANLRGSLCGVASLARYMDLENQTQLLVRPIQSASSPVHERRLVAFHPVFEMNTVLAVDQLTGLKSTDQMSKTLTPNIYLDEQEQVWMQIDLGLLAHNPRFISIESE
jgi:twitching motility protein PilI